MAQRRHRLRRKYHKPEQTSSRVAEEPRGIFSLPACGEMGSMPPAPALMMAFQMFMALTYTVVRRLRLPVRGETVAVTTQDEKGAGDYCLL